MASLLDALLGLPREEIVRELRLDDELGVALTDYSGPVGSLLELAERLDEGDFSAVEDLLSECGLSAESIFTAEIDAFQWAKNLQ